MLLHLVVYLLRVVRFICLGIWVPHRQSVWKALYAKVDQL